MGGTDTARGMGFQTACAMLHLVRAFREFPNSAFFRVEGKDETIDFEILDENEKPLLLAQAKTRVEPDGWTAGELLNQVRKWAEADPGGKATLRFLSDAPVSSTGQNLRNVALRARSAEDSKQWLSDARAELPAKTQLTESDLSILARLEINTRIGPWEQVLDQVKLEILRLSSLAMAASDIDDLTHSLFIELFKRSSERDICRRTIRTNFIAELLQIRVAEKSETTGATKNRKTILRNIPPSDHSYGRNSEIDEVAKYFQDDRKLGRKTFLLAGFGGIGKSTIAKRYIESFASCYKLIWWIDANSPTSISAAYREFLADAGDVQPADNEDVVKRLGRHLEREYGKFLLVYDNATDRGVMRSLPEANCGDFLITTRDSAWVANTDGTIVRALKQEDALEWYSSQLPGRPKDELERLANALERIPLSMAQAVAYISATGCRITQYIASLERYRVELLNDEETVPSGYDRGLTTVAAVLLSIDQVRGDRETSKRHALALEILIRCSFLAPTGIPLHIIGIGLPDGAHIYDAIRQLRKLSLVHVDDGFLSMHRIVQDIAKRSADPGMANDILQVFQYVLGNDLAQSMNEQDWGVSDAITEHALSVAGNVLSLGQPTVNTAGLISNIANVFAKVYGALDSAEVLLKRALQILEEIDSPETPYRKAATAESYAQVLYNARRHEEAIRYVQLAKAQLETRLELSKAEQVTLLRAYAVEMNANFAIDRISESMLAIERSALLMNKYGFDPMDQIRTLLDQAQIFAWRQEWILAQIKLTEAMSCYSPERDGAGEIFRFIECLRALSLVATGRLEEGLAIHSKITIPTPDSPTLVLRHYADSLIELAHAIVMQCGVRYETQSAPYDWPLRVADELLNSAAGILEDFSAPPHESMGFLALRRANLEMILYEISNDSRRLLEARENLIHAAGIFRNQVPGQSQMATVASQLLTVCEEALESGGSIWNRQVPREKDVPKSSPQREHLIVEPKKYGLPANRSDAPRLQEFSWAQASYLPSHLPRDLRVVLGTWNIMRFHLAGQQTPAPLLACKAYAAALSALNFSVHVIPASIIIAESNKDSAGVPASTAMPPSVDHHGAVVGHAIVWVEDIKKIIDPILPLVGEEIPDAEMRKAFELPAVLSSAGLTAFLQAQVMFARGDYFMGYVYRPQWTDLLEDVIDAAWSSVWDGFVEVLVRDTLSVFSE